jgi:hypothetical protein
MLTLQGEILINFAVALGRLSALSLRAAVFSFILVAILSSLLAGGALGACVTSEGARNGEFAQLATYHIFRNIHGHMFFAVVHRYRVAYHIGKYSGRSRPGLDRFFISVFVHSDYSFKQPFFDIRPFLY